MSELRVSLCQVASTTDLAANREQIGSALATAAASGSRLAILPEYATAFDPAGVGVQYAEPVDGPSLGFLRDQARRHGLTVVAGTTLTSQDPERGSNAVVVVDPDGTVRAAYRKVHLYDAFGHRESDRLEPGAADAEPVVVDVEGLRIGIETCYDLRFPEMSRRLVDAGAQVIVVPAAWAAGPGKVEQWTVLARARAIENTCAVLAVGQAGRGVVGHSIAVGPAGVVLGELGREPGALHVVVDGEEIARVREVNPSLANRRYTVVPR